MDIFEGRYFNLNKKLLVVIGLWPYETEKRKVIRAFFMVLLVFLSMPHLLSALLHYDDVDRLMFSVLVLLVGLLMVFKMIAFTVTEDKVKGLYESIAINWLSVVDEKERQILVDYSERGRFATILYTAAMSAVCIITSMVPIIPKVLDKVNPLEKQRPHMDIIQSEVFFDRKEYFVESFIIDTMFIVLVVLTTITIDSVYIVSIEHCCAINAIISYRLRNLGHQSNGIPTVNNVDDSYIKVRQIIELHKKTFRFISIINDAYSLIFLYIMTANIFALPLSACAIVAHVREPLLLCPYAVLFVALSIHLFTIFWPGQRALDHNQNTCDEAYYNQWYMLPLSTRKLLVIFMIRCTRPAILSAGGLFLINLESFSFVMRNAISYMTVLASFR